jgi:hypothetical protein
LSLTARLLLPLLLLLAVIGTLGGRRRGFATLLPRHLTLGLGQLLATGSWLMLGWLLCLLLFRLLLPGLRLSRLLTRLWLLRLLLL